MSYMERTENLNRDIGTIIVGTTPTLLQNEGYFDFQKAYHHQLTVYNGGEATFVAGVIEVCPNALDTIPVWATVMAIGGGSLGSAGLWTGTFAFSTYKYWRAKAAVASGSVATVVAWWRH